MTSANRIVQVLLLVVLAALCKKYFELQERYEELKLTCETNCIESQDKITENRLGKLKQNSKVDYAASIFMHSSTSKDDTKKNDDTIAIQKDEFVDANEPTFYNEAGKHIVTLTSPGLVINSAAGVVFQTSNVVGINQEVSTDTKDIKDGDITFMDSTNEVTVNPSEGLFLQVQLTQKNSQTHESHTEAHSVHSPSQLNTIYEINPSVTEMIHQSSNDNEKEQIFENHDTLGDENVEDDDDIVTTDDDPNSVSIHDKDELISSDSTEEKKLFVLQTSSEEAVNLDLNAYNYFDTDESTPVLNTGLYGDSPHLMTDVDYAQDIVEGVCDFEGCHDDEFYSDEFDEEDGSIELTVLDKSKKLKQSWDTILPDFIVAPNQEELFQFVTHGTSARCRGDAETTCQFQNLCYNTRERDFVFIKGEKSVIQMEQSNGLDADDIIEIENIFDINLSTIHGHNAAMFSVVTLPASLIDKFSIGMVNKRSIVLNRFKPDNIMHVLHDDVLPLFQTLTDMKYPILDNAFDVAIVFADKYDKGNYIDLYSSLSTVNPVSLWQYNQTYDLLCFPDIRVGLETSTLWYQYGFFQPQGPISTREKTVYENILTATQYLSPHFQFECFLCSQGNYLVFLSRKDNRLILNEGELIMSVTKSTRLKVMSVSLETHSLPAIITTIRLSRGVIGMHGSLLSLAVFLPPGSIVIELFPFAVPPSNYTPFKTFCDLPESNLIYKSWANPSEANSVPHPDRPANEGGIRHLSTQLQSEIISQSSVPQHLCCDDPSWLYHIYQDSIVNANDVVTLILDGLRESENVSIRSSHPSSSSSSKTIFSKDIPGSVKNLLCNKVDTSIGGSSHVSFVASWDSPWLFDYDLTAPRKYKYELAVQEGSNKDSVRMFELPAHDTSYSFKSSTTTGSNAVHNVWLRVIGDDGERGQAKFVRCS